MVATILGVSVTIGYGISQFIDGLYAITGMEWIMDMSGEAPAPGTVGLIAGLMVIMGLSIISAVSGVGRGVKYLSNLNLVLSLVLLFTFVLFGSFFFAMTTYATAFVDYIINFFSLSFSAYGPQSAAAFDAALPAEAAPFADALRGGATNAWGSFDGFVGGLEGDAAALSPEVLQAAYAAGEGGRQFWLASWLDNILLGLVDRVLTVRGPVPRAYLQRTLSPRIHRGLCLCASTGLFCLDDHSWRNGN